MRKLSILIFTLAAFCAFCFLNARYHVHAHSLTQQCYPLGFQVKGEPWAANSIVSATACAYNGTPAGNVDINHNDQLNFIFDSQIGTMDGVPAHATVTHQTGWTPPSDPVAGTDFDVFIDPVNPSKFRMKFTPSTTHQIAVGDSICVDFTFATGNAVTAPVSFFSSVTGFGTSLPSNTITVQ